MTGGRSDDLRTSSESGLDLDAGSGRLGSSLLAWSRLVTAHHQVLALDLRGHGHSAAAAWTWDSAIADIDAVVYASRRLRVTGVINIDGRTASALALFRGLDPNWTREKLTAMRLVQEREAARQLTLEQVEALVNAAPSGGHENSQSVAMPVSDRPWHPNSAAATWPLSDSRRSNRRTRDSCASRASPISCARSLISNRSAKQATMLRRWINKRTATGVSAAVGSFGVFTGPCGTRRGRGGRRECRR
jgi:pimeloyl-ACP methyl ester carboxylesterase